MESKVLRCVIVIILGIISAILAFAGEITRVKLSQVFMVAHSCVYPSTPAPTLGIASAILTIITRIYISISFGRGGCCRTDLDSTLISKFLFVLSWVASILAIVLLLAAAGLNVREGGEVDNYGSITCYVVKPGIFTGGAILALLSSIFGIAAYITILSPSQAIMDPAIALSTKV